MVQFRKIILPSKQPFNNAKFIFTGKSKKGMQDDLVMTLMIGAFWGREFLKKRIAGVPYNRLKSQVIVQDSASSSSSFTLFGLRSTCIVLNCRFNRFTSASNLMTLFSRGLGTMLGTNTDILGQKSLLYIADTMYVLLTMYCTAREPHLQVISQVSA